MSASRNLGRILSVVLMAATVPAVCVSTARGQVVGGQQGGQQAGQAGVPGVAGIHVDASGVLKRMSQDPTGRLTDKVKAAKEARNRFAKELGKAADETSALRVVSLNRLEEAVRECLDQNKPITPEMQLLAGLTRVECVFYLKESNDIAIAGPAEMAFIDPEGQVRGMQSGLPLLRLEDLVVALRAFPPAGQPTPVISCSIDPTQEGNAAAQRFLNSLPRTNPNIRVLEEGLRKAMGMQVVTIRGISPKTRFANVLVTADYRMKLIGMGKERAAAKIKSFVELSHGDSSGLVRWFFTPDYDTATISDDKMAVELSSAQGVRLLGEDELVGADGTRSVVGKATGASKRFVDGFTEKYPELARAEPIYAELRNMMDLAIAAAFIQQQDFHGQAGWRMETLGDESQYAVEKYAAPKEIETAVHVVSSGRKIAAPFGGVTLQPSLALDSTHLRRDEQGTVHAKYRRAAGVETEKTKWWWDAR